MGQVEELRNAVVVRTEQLGEDHRVNRGPVDHPEPVPGEEVHLEGEAEHPSQTETTGPVQQCAEQAVPDAAAAASRVHGKRADLGEVRPHDVQRAAPDDLSGLVERDLELLDRLEVADELLGQQDALVGVLLDEIPDGDHVTRHGRADGAGRRLVHGFTVLSRRTPGRTARPHHPAGSRHPAGSHRPAPHRSHRGGGGCHHVYVSSIVTALGTLAVIAATGWLLGRLRVLGDNAAPVLARVTFMVAIPALLVVTVAHADLHRLVSRPALATVISTGLVIAVAVAVFRGLWHLGIGEATVATLASSYLNAVHLGIPIAVYLVGDAVAVVPTLLLQQLVLAPVAFALLDRPHAGEPTTADQPRGRSWLHPRQVLRRTLRNPLVVATCTGLLLSALPWDLPEAVFEPLRVLGAAAAPMALVVFGMSLAVRRPPGRRLLTRELTVVMVLRGVVHPLLAATVCKALGVGPEALLAVVTMAALPTAQNVLVYALQYGRGATLARDAGVVTTLLTAPTMLVVAVTLG